MALLSDKQLTLDYKHVLVDEIALEGLEGTGIDLLWRRVEKRLSITLTNKMKNRFWKSIVNNENISFYALPKPLPYVEILDRFKIVDEVNGDLKEPDQYLDGPYEYCPIENEYGSCSNYKVRVPVAKDKLLPYEKALSEYGDLLVMVASFEERWHALASHVAITCLNQLSSIHYCMLELVGKSRENGQMTVGKTNLTNISKDPKLLFYNRNHLQKMNLVKVQNLGHIAGGRGVKGILLRLKRFYQPTIHTMPKVGKIHNVLQHLLSQPDYSERCDVIIKKGYLTQRQAKRLSKIVNIFTFEERMIQLPAADTKKVKKHSPGTKKRFITLSSISDDDDSSDEETNETPLECQYKIGVGLLRQAYEAFLEAGLKGLTQIELAQIVGLEFYTSRTICRIFKGKKIVREFLEDKGRQRTTRFIAIAATGEVDVQYAEEKKKFLEYLDSSNLNDPTNENDYEVPKKKIKLESHAQSQHVNDINYDNMDTDVTELKVIDGLDNFNNESLINAKKNPTLRQLKFANGLLKVIREKLTVSGYQMLSNFVAKEINEPPMDTKALKLFVQRLVIDGQLKIFKIKWPGFQQKHTILICAPHLTAKGSVIRSKYKEICIRALSSQKSKTKREWAETEQRPLSRFAYPRYMKVQKFHELLFKFVYIDDVKRENKEYPEGFSTLIQIIPEMSIEFAFGNISNVGLSDVSHLSVSDNLLPVKLRDAPPDLYRVLLQSKSLHNSIRMNLKVLAMLGLVQLVNRPGTQTGDSANVTNFLFYVNRNAKVLDTTGIWPREDVDVQALEKSFHFDNLNDLTKYWDTVFEISTNTTICLNERDRKKLMAPVRDANEVYSYDTGEYFGDGKGPCGFDSCFYMDIERLWRTFYIRATTSTRNSTLKKKSIIKIPKVDTKKKHKLKVKKKIQKPVVAEEKPPILKSYRKRNNETITWSKQEDSVLMMCKAAITIMSPNSQPGCLRVRNTVAKDILSINDPKKTGSVCHKRSLQLESNLTLAHEKECILNELKRRRHITQKYEGLLKRIRIRNSANLSKYVNEARIPMMELVWIIVQIIKSESYIRRMPCIAMNLTEFHENYIITASTANKSYNLYKTPFESGPELAALKESIVLTVMLSYNYSITPETGKKIYHMYKDYTEQLLRTAVEHLRKSSVLSAKEKIMNNQMHKMNFEDIVQSSYKMSAAYLRKWNNRFNVEFIENLTENLYTEIPETGIKATAELNCLLCEMQSCDVLEVISVTVPAIASSSGSFIQEDQLNVIDIETKFKLKSGTLGWKNKSNMKTFSEFYQNDSHDHFIDILTSNALVKFPENQICDVEDKIISHLKNKAEQGATFSELEEISGYDYDTLIEKLTELESKNIIKRVGYFENIVLLTEYAKLWSLNVGGTYFLPSPWLTLDPRVRHEILVKWGSIIMNKVFENPGLSISSISNLCEMISTRSTQEACMFLERCKCVVLKSIKYEEPSLFSDDDVPPQLVDFNEYDSVDKILVFPVKDSIAKWACLRKKMLDEYYEMMQDRDIS